MKASHYDVVIIGAGMSGLAAGIRLAHFGKKVCIFERHNTAGGLNSFYSFDGRKYDVGLHAMTNYVAPGVKGTPLGKLLRQLRIEREEFALRPQKQSRIAFRDCSLRFTNDFAVLESEIAAHFPAQVDGWRTLVQLVRTYDDVSLDAQPISAREVVGRHITDPLLRDMLFCPVMYYGSAQEHDMEFGQFVIMFKALYLEGFARPLEGVRVILRVLLDKYRAAGGERRMKCGVARIIEEQGRAARLVLDTGEEITAGQIISSIGFAETMNLCEPPQKQAAAANTGALSFVETISVYRQPPADWGWGDDTIIFFNDTDHFDYSRAREQVDLRSGVICLPNNFDYAGQNLAEGIFRVTCLADYDQWAQLPEATYQADKKRWFGAVTRSARRFLPPVTDDVLDQSLLVTDMFTPRTIKKFTGHLNGAIYGSPQKIRNGRTHLSNLYLCGTDQGFLGIVGAMLSGISMANYHICREPAAHNFSALRFPAGPLTWASRMAYDWLKGIEDHYDIVVIGSGLGGLTGANVLAKCGHKVLLLEHHYQLGGLATWFTRKGGHIFDISLHGFPYGMIKSIRKYWSQDIADSIIQLKGVRFINPQFSIETTFDREDFTRQLVEKFKVAAETVERFFTDLRAMNFYDNNTETTGQMFERYFPGRDDVQRLLMEPIAYANGSTLDDPAITFGIVFSNFMSKGVYTFQGGSDVLIKKMGAELKKNGVEVRRHVVVEKILTEVQDGKKRVTGVVANGRTIPCHAVLSNANIKSTVLRLAGEDNFSPEFVAQTKAVRVNSSSCQVYLGIRKGESLPHIGDLVFTSEEPKFSSEKLVDLHTTSRTFSLYYPDTRPGSDRYTVVVSINAKYADWNELSPEHYAREKQRLIDESIVALEKYIPDVRGKIDWMEAATPRTIEYYTRHWAGTSFGTKFEGLKVSMDLPTQLPGLYHAGSVGIIMSGWLGTINYGVIVSNQIDKFMAQLKSGSTPASATA